MPQSPTPDQTRADLVRLLALLWLGGVASRMPILAIPPVIPLIHDDLHLSETAVGFLIGLPLGMFALAAVPGSLFVARPGVRRVLAAASCSPPARRRRAAPRSIRSPCSPRRR
jgi:CP family cyanate transporter-like MFS transporter